MSILFPRLLGFAGSGLAAAVFTLPLTSLNAQEEREIVIGRVVVEEKGEKEEKDDDDDDEKRPAYWIGIALDGPGGPEGLKVAEVYPESPALKAELKPGDVLIAVGDKKLEHAEQLIDLVQDSQGKTLKIKLVRDGKEMVREVHPGKRPDATRVEEKEEKEEKEGPNRYAPKPGQPGAKKEEPKGVQPPIAWRKIEVAPKAGGSEHSGSGTIHLYGAPGAGGSSFPPGTTPQPMMARLSMRMPEAQLPDDMEVTISKKGNRPAVVTAKQGDKLWKTTEKELGMLPGPAQAYAARILGHDVLRSRMPGAAPGMGGMGMPGMPGMGGMSSLNPQPLPPQSGAPARREIRSFELRLDEDGKVTGVQGGGNLPHVKRLPGGGIQVEIREDGEEKSEKTKTGKSAEPKEDAEKGARVRQLQLQAEQLRALLEKLKAEVKEKKE